MRTILQVGMETEIEEGIIEMIGGIEEMIEGVQTKVGQDPPSLHPLRVGQTGEIEIGRGHVGPHLHAQDVCVVLFSICLYYTGSRRSRSKSPEERPRPR